MAPLPGLQEHRSSSAAAHFLVRPCSGPLSVPSSLSSRLCLSQFHSRLCRRALSSRKDRGPCPGLGNTEGRSSLLIPTRKESHLHRNESRPGSFGSNARWTRTGDNFGLHSSCPGAFAEGLREAGLGEWRRGKGRGRGRTRGAFSVALHCTSVDVDCMAAKGSGPLDEFALFAQELADEARKIVPKYFRQPIPINAKSDQSPVTQADVEVERAVRSLIGSRYPNQGILGEEEGVKTGDLGDSASGVTEYTWVVDPIDGTASFITGKPLFGVLIALLHHGVPVLGLLDQPILKERWVGVKGQGTTFNGERVQTRKGRCLTDAYMYTTSPHLFPTPEADKAFNELRTTVKRVNYGCDCYAFGLLSIGFVDVALEFGTKPWDYMALVPIVSEAGGLMTDGAGDELTLQSWDAATWPGNIVASGSPELHSQVVAKLALQ